VKITFVAWVDYHRRSELLAQHLGATIHYISCGQQGRILQAPQKYLRQAWETWQILCQERPDVIFVQNPPIFCALVAFFYARRYAARYAIDSHSGAFISRKWRWSLLLHRLLSRAALVTIVHNKSQEVLVSRWGCRYCVIGFTPGNYPVGTLFQLNGRFNIAVIASFMGDEPIDLVFEAAHHLPEARFYVTGDYCRMPSALLSKKPANCFLTGYLPYDQYVGLLREVDAIMILTTRDNSLLMGGFEAVSLGTPLIISDWPTLRDYFCLGTVHIPNTVEGIREGVHRAQRERARLRQEILLLRQQLQAEWEQKFTELQQLLQPS
jgi:glycosyltransferase involved in cell wall biosynthesis